MGKTLVMIIGAGATGKSTLSRTLAGPSAQEHRIELDVTEKGVRKRVKAPYVVGSDIAIAGNLKNTSDAIGAMDALHQTIDHCWKERDVVITDGFRCTNRLVRWVEDHPLNPAALFVYIELSLNSNIARLRGRRAGNGKTESKLPPKTFLNVLNFRERALGVWNYAQDNYHRQPVRFLELPEGLEPEGSARLIEIELGQFGIPRCTEHRKTPEMRRESPVVKVGGATVGTVFNVQSFDRGLSRWENHLLDLTPVENIGGMWWKREDKFAPLGYGNINGSKLRQLIWLFSQKEYPGVVSGAVTGSPQLPMVAACAKHWNIPCVQFTGGQGEMVTAGEKFGAETRLINPGYAATLNAKAKEESASKGWLHIETNITLEHKINPAERIEAFHRVGSEQVRNIPDHIEHLLIPAGSCNSLTSILYGLGRFRPESLKTVHLFRIMGNVPKHKKWTDERLDIIRKVTGEELPLPYEFVEHDLVDGGYTTYKEMKPYSYGGLAFHPRYEGKCLNYIKENLAYFRSLLNANSLFWIVGSQPQ
jgi:hypothetical protein